MARDNTGKTLGAAPSQFNYELGDQRLRRQRVDSYNSAGTICRRQKTGFDPLSPDYYLGFIIVPSGFTTYWRK
jgi:hypothetical protein